MPTNQNIADMVGKGITVDAFVSQMKPEYQEKLNEWQEGFTWVDHSQEVLSFMRTRSDLHCSIIASDWCGDVHRNFPVIIEVMNQATVPVEVFVQENHPSFIDVFRTLGGKSVPKVIISNTSGDVHFTWGPRPAFIQEPMAYFKSLQLKDSDSEYAAERTKAYEGIQARYGEDFDYQKLVVYELTNLLSQT
ncbi:thioredoxin family protein [Sinobaca sp. H24]|uniref:thioredoxin family protein n=1 Tax=Sinobaca sp. H24 TaxID=2923376 RepID=UPI00207AA7CE|nr:thioredoxin family protein [Sinobaca sp. H24]